MKLKYKFLLPLVSVLFFSFTVIVFFIINIQLKEYRTNLYIKAERTTSLLAQANKFALWNFESDSMAQICNSFFEDKELIKIIIRDAKGREQIHLQKKDMGGRKLINKKPVVFKNGLINKTIGEIETIHTSYYIDKSITNMVYGFVLTSLIFCVILIALVFTIFYIVLKPLSSISKSLEKISRDDFDVHLNVKSKDEIGMLAQNINETARKLKESFSKREKASMELLTTNQLLTKEKSKLAKIADTVPGAICTFYRKPDGSESVLYASPFFVNIFGLPPEELIKNPSAIRDKIHKEDYKQIREDIYASAQDFSAWQSKYRFEHPQKGERWIEGHFLPSKEPDQSIIWHGIFLDITERKQTEDLLRASEKKFSATFRLNPNALSITRVSDGTIFEINKGFTTVFGYTDQDVKGKTSVELNLWPSEKERTKSIEKLLAEGKLENEEIQCRAKNGDLIYAELSSTIIEVNKEKAILSEIIDTTARKKMEEQLRNSQKMESIGNLAGGIAHDFNNLLTPIIGMAEILLEDLPENSFDYESVKEIFNAGMRARDLVKQILAFSRQSEHQITPVRIQNVLKEVLKLSRSTIPSNIKLKENIQKNCGLVMADPTQIHQIIMNLITNAFHAVEEKMGKIDVELSEILLKENELPDCTIPPGKYVKLTISDDGTGMSREVKDKIFDPYFTTKEQGKGTGLGLAVVYGIVKNYNGEIRVQSELEKGTVFDVYLPLMEKTSDAITSYKKPEKIAGSESILLVDDEIMIVKLEDKMLSRLGYKVTSKTSSKEALAAFKESPDSFDLVISDMAMPGMTGDQLSAKILSIKPDIPIIVCTGFSERISQEKAENLGIKGFLMKPIAISDMALMIRKLLDETKMKQRGADG